MDPQWLLVAVGAAVAPIITFLIYLRKSSGKIQTTEANQLWDILLQHVQGLEARIGSQQEVINTLRDRVDNLESERDQLRRENLALIRRLERVENGEHT